MTSSGAPLHRWLHRVAALTALLSQAVAAGGAPVHMVVTAAFVSEDGLPVYDELAQYLTQKMHRTVDVTSGTSYSETNTLIDHGIIQVGFVCGLPYTESAGTFKLLAMPAMRLQAGQFDDVPGYEDVPGKYYSYVIVRKDASYDSWQSLRGARFVYNDQNSNSGYNMPRYRLIQDGVKSWEEYFSEVQVSGSHEESIRLVARGMVDASAVDSLVLDYDRVNGNPDALQVKVIEVLFPGGAGAPPVIVSHRTEPELVGQLQGQLLSMHQDARGREILERALISRFLPPDDHNYDDIRNMARAARESGFRDHVP